MTRLVLAAALLALVYALALASADPWDLAAGAGLGAVLVVLLRGFVFREPARPPSELPRRALAAVPLALAVLGNIAVGTWQVALVVLHLRPLRSPGIVAVPIEERTRSGVAVTALLATLSPGEFLVDVDWERRIMLVHVLDGSDPDGVRARHREFYRRYQRAVFP